MKFKPSTPSNSQREKIHYCVTIEGEQYNTYAYSEEVALSNAAWRYAEEVDEDVALIKWQLSHDKLYFDVEEV